MGEIYVTDEKCTFFRKTEGKNLGDIDLDGEKILKFQ
jgi:hypothetical protein